MDSKTRYSACSALVALLSVLIGDPAIGAGDPKRGAQVFQGCMACHSVKRGDHMTGPSLADIWNRKAGTVEGFLRYSDAIKRADVIWTDATLDKWLGNPDRFLSGTSMTFPGLKQGKDRQDVIAYLKAVSEGKVPAGARERGVKANLKQAPARARVTSIEHCRDTYTVKTADGGTAKLWEFNLRLKTDSSNDGPRAGEPVIMGAGMQGDRVSVIFATPSEISGFIKHSCQ